MAIACGAMVVASCSKSAEDYAPDPEPQETPAQLYSKAFNQVFGTPAANQNWGFGSFKMVDATEPEGSPLYVEPDNASRRAVAESVTGINPVKYNNADDVLAEETPFAYFYLRIDNKIVLQELNGVVGNNSNDYYPKDNLNLGNDVKDSRFNTDNQGRINMEEYKKLDLIINNSGVTFATKDKPIPNAVFKEAPTFETMAMHIPDTEKIKLAGSVEDFNSENFKIFWYVVKWQSADKIIHVDGVLVPTDQITVNIPEYKKRIIVEDLRGNITANTKVNSSDFDYNDVVFDAVTWNRDNQNHLKIIVRCAGGTLPIYVAGKEIHQGGITTMFNTSNPNYDFSYVLVEDSIIGTAAQQFDFNSIPVEVEIDGKRISAGSNLGEAPEKIAVGLDYKWCKERQSIKEVYPRFLEYVGNKDITNWWKSE